MSFKTWEISCFKSKIREMGDEVASGLSSFLLLDSILLWGNVIIVVVPVLLPLLQDHICILQAAHACSVISILRRTG